MLDRPAAPREGGAASICAPHERQRDAGVLLLIAVAASLALHAGAFGIGLLRPRPPVAAPAEQAVSVEILSPEEAAALTAPPPPAIEAAPEPETELAALPPKPEREPLPTAPPAMVRPRRMLSARELADPRSAEARAILRKLDDADRMIQLCGIEAMAQVQAWRDRYRPDRIVAYAGAEVAVSGDVVDAGEAAFRSGDAWYALTYQCQLAPDHATVTAFAFTVGDLIPPAEWEARNLPDPALDSD